MTNEIHTGTIFIKDGTYTPDVVEFASDHDPAGWREMTKPSTAELGKDLDRAGWTFFFMAGGIQANGFGFNVQSRTKRALLKVIKLVDQEKCNCLEIGEVRQRSFLGMPFTSVGGRSRHIQKSRSFEQVWATSVAN